MFSPRSALWPAGLVIVWALALLPFPGSAAQLAETSPLKVLVGPVPREFQQGGLRAADLKERLENMARTADPEIMNPAGENNPGEAGELVLKILGDCGPDRLCIITLRLDLIHQSRSQRTVEVTEPIGRNNVQQVRRLVKGLFERLMAGEGAQGD